MARAVIPVEMVTAPLSFDQLDELERFCAELRRGGAMGTGANPLFGFGVHFNVEVSDPHDAHTRNVVLALGLVEDWLRTRDLINTTRSALPYTDPWPHDFVDALVSDRPDTLDGVMALYAKHVDSRNHGLDLLPLFKSGCPDTFGARFPDHDTAGRPAFHFRMADCRIDEED